MKFSISENLLFKTSKKLEIEVENREENGDEEKLGSKKVFKNEGSKKVFEKHDRRGGKLKEEYSNKEISEENELQENLFMELTNGKKLLVEEV
jgi:hypothetical protein